MRKILLLLSIISLSWLLPSTASASHIAGGEITYEHLGNDSFLITLTLYRDCQGVPLTGGKSITVFSSCTGSQNMTLNLQNFGGTEISQICPAQINQSTCNGGNLPGMEQYIYSAIIQLSTHCSDYSFTYNTFARNDNENFTGGINTWGILIDATLNSLIYPNNSSPEYTANPIPYVCINQAVNYNYGVVENDGDSLSYALIAARQNGVPITYVAGFTPTSPIPGITINSVTGELNFTPALVGKFVIVTQVTEYNGAGQVISTVERDIQFVVLNCANTIPATPAATTNLVNTVGSASVTAPLEITANVGDQFCFDVTFTDVDAGTTLSITSNASTALPGSTVTFSGTNPATATVCWTVPPGMNTNNAVTFQVNDNACPISGANSVAVTIIIPPPSNVTGVLTTTNISCNGICDGTASVVASGGVGPYSYQWQGLGMTGCCQGNSSITGLCPGDTNVYSVLIIDLGDPDPSNNFYFEKFIISGASAIITTSPTVIDDDCTANCVGGISLFVVPTTGTPPLSYLWNSGQTSTNISNVCAGTYTLTITDANNCTKTISAIVQAPVPPTILIDSTDSVTCFGGNDGAVYARAYPTCGVSTDACAAPVSIELGTGNASNTFSTYPAPYGNAMNGARHQMLFTAAELTAAGVLPGTISSFAMDIAGIGTTINYANFTIRMGCTSVTDLTGGWESGLTEVFTPKTHVASVGWNTHNLDVKYFWDGLSNIVVEVCFNNPTATGSGNALTSFTPTTNQSVRYYADNTMNVCSSNNLTATSVNRPNVRFGNCESTFTWAWSPAPAAGQTTPTATNLTAQTYNVTVTSVGDGCEVTTTATVGQPPLIVPTITLTNAISCPGVCDASISVASVGGQAPYTYAWDNGLPAGSTQNNLCAGTYTVTVTDAKLCTVTESITITEPPLITATTTINTPISCNGICDGDVTINGAGGTAPLTYAWPGGLVGANQTNLCAGTYDVTITDASACFIVETVILTEPAVLTVSLATVGTILCNGDMTVNINSTVAGGTVNYTYAWSSGQTTANLTNIGAGTYMLTVTDAHNCTAIDQVTITEPTPLVGAIVQTAFIQCNGDLTASLTASASGGTPGYTFLWNNGIATAINSNIGAGNYSVTITDANNCTDVQNITVTEPTAVLANLTIDTQISCNGVCDGVVSVAPSGGTGPYTVTWQAGMTAVGNTATGLCGATAYDVTITDASNCQIVEAINLTEPSLLTAVINLDQGISCGGVCDGQLTAAAAGGTAGYTFSWSNGMTSATISNLCAGNYSVTITDNNNCTATSTMTLTQPNPLIGSIAQAGTILCNGDLTVTLTASETGGTAAFTYLWSNGIATAINANIGAGIYTVTITDANNCTDVVSQTITEPQPLLISGTVNNQISCNGVCDGDATVSSSGGTAPYVFTWTGGLTGANQTNLCAGSYIVTVTDANNCTQTTTIDIIEPAAIVMTQVVNSNVSCNGVCDGDATVTTNGGSAPVVITWPGGLTGGNQTTLCAGTYTVTATDANLCTNTISVTVTEPAAMTVSIAQVGSVLCNGDNTVTINSTVVGGTMAYTYAWNTGANSANLTNVGAGTYTVTVTDANLCTATTNITVTEPTLLDVTITQTAFISCGGAPTAELLATGTGGTTNYTFLWSTGASTATISNLGAGAYSVTITDANGCTDTDNFTITQPTPVVPNQTLVSAITCNGVCDGSVTYAPSGGVAPYTITWPAGVTAVNDTATLLCANTTYTVTITDANGCTMNDDINLIEPTAVTVSINLDAGVSCGGVCDAQVTATGTGGTGAYIYTWSNGIVGATNNNLCAGTYTVTVSDANNCTGTAVIIITEPNPVFTTISVTGTILCFGDSTVDLTATTTGGTAPYTYLWNMGSTGSTLTGVGAGLYSVVTTDANSCSVTTTVTVTEPLDISLTANITPMSCGGVCDGAATIIAVGGTGAMTFAWPGGNTSPTQTNLCAGDYIVTVTDANACSDTITVSIVNPTSIVIITNVVSHTSCNGVCDGVAEITITGGTAPLTIAWPSGGNGTTETALCAGSHTVTVTDAGGCSNTATIVINDAPVISVNLVETSGITCNGVCDGIVSSSVSGGTAPYTVVWPGNDTTDIKTALCAGTYVVTVVDANACSVTETITITEPAAITTTIAITTAISCNSVCDGVLTATVVGGTGPYTATWSDGTVGMSASSLCAGTYTVDIVDANGCTSTASMTLTEPSAIVPVLAIRNTFCGRCFGRIIVQSVTGGDGGPYTYTWSGGVQLPPFPDRIVFLCAGSYSLTITDASGCSSVFTETISSRGGPNNPVFTSTPPTCNGGSDGTITISASNGSPPYTYLWSSGGTAATETGLSAGPYTVTVTDTNGCELVATETLVDPDAIENTETLTDASCNGVCDGTISLTTVNGTAPYTYAWSNAATGSSITSLCAGTYNVTTTDANACSVVDTFIISEPTIVTVSLAMTNPIACNGVCEGELTATATGGTAPYTMNWSNGGSGNIAIGLCAGLYTVTVTDANGCTTTGSMSITEPAAVSSTITAVDATCGACDGSITLIGTTGGDGGPYTFAWSNGESTAAIINLCAGTYTVTITDGSGCNSIISTPISNTGGPTSAPITRTDPSCNGVCDGALTVTPAGGTMPYTYRWSNGGTTDTETGLCPNIYFITVTDANGCVFIGTDTIVDPSAIINTDVIANASCNGVCDGTITLTTSGGTGPYTFAWSNGNTGNSVTSLCAGTYSVTTTDANMCTTTNNYTITEPTVINSSITVDAQISCNGICDGELTADVTGGTAPFTFLWSNGMVTASITSLCAGTFDVTVTDAGNCTSTATMTLTDPAIITASITSTNATCGICDGQVSVTNVAGGAGAPYTYVWSNGMLTPTITNLCPATYTVTITDGSGCTVVLSSSVSNNGGPTAATFVHRNPSCNGVCDGVTQVTPIGGAAPFTYLWSTGSIVDSTDLACAGNYTVTITDASGCVLIVSDTLTEPTQVVNFETITDASCNGVCDGSISITTTGGTVPYTYLWSNAATGPNITGLCVGTYSVTTTDSAGCTAVDTFTIAEPGGMSLAIASSDATCFNVCDGGAVVKPTGGTAPYTYVWSNGTASDTVSNLCAGSSYDVTVTDANGCTIVGPVNISGPPVIVIDNIAITDASCGMSNGAANATASGGTGVLIYTWDGVIGNPLSNVPAGVYTLVVSDANGCSISVNVPINNDVGPSITVTGSNLTCFGDNSGSAMVTVAGTGTYSYLWNTGSTNSSITGLSGGSYYVEVTDAATGCQSSDTITIVEPTEITIDNVITTSPTCGSMNGGAMAFASGGSGVLTYAWNGTMVNPLVNAGAGTYTLVVSDAAGCSTQTVVPLSDSGQFVASASGTDLVCFGNTDGTASVAVVPAGSYAYQWTSSATDIMSNVSGLAAGTYGISVTDPLTGCTASDTVVISSPPELRIDNVNLVNPSCGAADGSLEAFVSGGTPGYSYVWNGTSTGNPIINIPAGAYALIVTDTVGCTVNTTVPLSDTGSVLVSFTTTDVPCDGTCIGTATATPSGGSGTYNFSWSNGDNTAMASNLCAGLHTVTITDATGGCMVIDTVTVNQASGLGLTMSSTDNTNCNGICDGTSLASVTGSTGTVTYAWSNGGSGSALVGLCAGTFVVTVTDATGCSAVDSVTITDGPTMVLTVDTVINASCPNTNDGEVQITTIGGVSPYTYSWTGPGGFTSSNQNISFLFPGTYIVEVTGVNGCMLTDSAIVNANTDLSVFLGDLTICDAVDSVTLVPIVTGATGIISYQWYNIGGGVIGNDSTLKVIMPLDTTYYVIGVVANGCTATDTGFVAPGQIPDVDAGVSQSIVVGQEVVLGGNPTTSWGGSTFIWTPDVALNDDTDANPIASPSETTLYQVMVTNIVGCSASDSILIVVTNKLPILSGFSPNGDGINDTWELDILDKYPSAVIDVYNRWGELLFHSDDGYQIPWDGKFEGTDVPIGTYYFVIDLKDGDFPDPISGPVTIVR